MIEHKQLQAGKRSARGMYRVTVKWPYLDLLFIQGLFKTKFLPHGKSKLAGGSEPSSTSRKVVDSCSHVVSNPMLAERDVQTKHILKGSVWTIDIITYSSLLYKSKCLKSEAKYETKNIKVCLVWWDLRRSYNGNTISSFSKEYLNNTSMRQCLV